MGRSTDLIQVVGSVLDPSVRVKPRGILEDKWSERGPHLRVGANCSAHDLHAIGGKSSHSRSWPSNFLFIRRSKISRAKNIKFIRLGFLLISWAKSILGQGLYFRYVGYVMG
ncbi:hypothetical protein V6N13_118451 [Hibiscus sabdariffa]